MTRKQPPPPYIWRWLGLAAVLLLLLAVATIAIISAGVLDPPPAGPPVTRYAPGRVEVTGENVRHHWVAEVPPDEFTIRLEAAHAGGELDSGYGLILGEEGEYLVAAVSPLGYAAVWQHQDQEQEMLFPWQPWPHVATGTSPNEIQITISTDTLTIRINGELLWQGTGSSDGDHAGTFLQSFGESTAVDFRSLSLYQPTPTN